MQNAAAMRQFLHAVLAAALLAGLGQTRALAAVDDAELGNEKNGIDWPAYGRTFSEQRFSPLDQINRQTVSRLGLAWSLELPDVWNVSSAPVAVDGVIYFAVGFSVIYAVDAASGRQLWSYDPKVAPQKMRMAWGIRGLSFWKGKVIAGVQDGRLFALDAQSGKLVWESLTTEPGDNRYITGAPRVFNGKVIIGHGGADFGQSAATSAPTMPKPARCCGAGTSCPATQPRASRTRPWKWRPRPGRASGGSSAAAAPPGTR